MKKMHIRKIERQRKRTHERIRNQACDNTHKKIFVEKKGFKYILQLHLKSKCWEINARKKYRRQYHGPLKSFVFNQLLFFCNPKCKTIIFFGLMRA